MKVISSNKNLRYNTRDTRSTVAVPERLSIPLHPIASEPNDANSITDNEHVV